MSITVKDVRNTATGAIAEWADRITPDSIDRPQARVRVESAMEGVLIIRTEESEWGSSAGDQRFRIILLVEEL